MKKTLGLLFLLMALICTSASANTMDVLKPIWLNALEDIQAENAIPASELPEPAVVSGTQGLEVVRSAVYMSDHYSPEAYIYAELKNTGDSVFYVNSATLTVLDASGSRVSDREYVGARPEVIMPGESLFVSEWLYDFVSSLSRVHSIEVKVERSEYGFRSIEKLESTRAYIDGDYLYAEVTNAGDKPIFEFGVTAVMLDGNGRIRDMLYGESYSNVGVAPGSTILFRKRLEEHALNIPDAACEAKGYAYGDRLE